MRSYVLSDLAKLAKAFGFVISGVAILFVISIVLKKFGYVRFIGPLILSIIHNVLFALFGPVTSYEMNKFLTQSSADKLSDRMGAVVGTVAIIILLWVIGDATWHLILKRKKQTRVIGVKRLRPLILICVAVVGFDYHWWSDQMEQDKAMEATMERMQKVLQEGGTAQQERERVLRELDELQKIPAPPLPEALLPRWSGPLGFPLRKN